MCSICGFYSSKPLEARATAGMISRTRHRGPDAVGIYLDGAIDTGDNPEDLCDLLDRRGRISLGQARLQICGGPEAVQPLTGCRPGWAIVVNGEIYNYRSLRKFLDGPHRFTTDGDSELILHLIESHYRGNLAEAVRKTLPLLDGMYAFAVTDGQRIAVARDPIGKKPVYFSDSDPVFFASERKALAGQGRTLRRLVPGGILELGGPRRRVIRTPRFERPPVDITNFDEALDLYRALLRKAVEKRVAGLDRVGVLFSGGIDSLLICVAARNAGTNVTAYCVGMEGSEDLAAARQAEQLLGLNVRYEDLNEPAIEEILPEIIEKIELNGLVQVEAAIPMYVAARRCSEEGHKVMLTGQAADELFAGYSWYGNVVREQGHAVLHERLWDDIEKLYLDTLEREDRMAMAHAIELRAPFLDRDVIRGAMRMVPQKIKIDGPDDPLRKLVHRRLALDLGIPEALAYRVKSRAQDGTGIHHTIKSIAKRRKVPARRGFRVPDYGSNYRYVADEYAGDEVHAFIAHVTEQSGVDWLCRSDEEEYEMELRS
ncbi:MAG: asparagine synthetase B [Planctomycetes bacterium]|nr:asparagine synthetase B [Planctomycetota bacterium]